MYCDKCGEQSQKQDKFCIKCGNKIVVSESIRVKSPKNSPKSQKTKDVNQESRSQYSASNEPVHKSRKPLFLIFGAALISIVVAVLPIFSGYSILDFLRPLPDLRSYLSAKSELSLEVSDSSSQFAYGTTMLIHDAPDCLVQLKNSLDPSNERVFKEHVMGGKALRGYLWTEAIRFPDFNAAQNAYETIREQVTSESCLKSLPIDRRVSKVKLSTAVVGLKGRAQGWNWKMNYTYEGTYDCESGTASSSSSATAILSGRDLIIVEAGVYFCGKSKSKFEKSDSKANKYLNNARMVLIGKVNRLNP